MKAIEIMWKGPVKPRRLLTSLMLVWLIFPASALAANPPSIASSFSPSSIGIGDTSTLSFTITNPPSNGSLTGIGFTDTLPSGVVVDAPIGVGGKCGAATLSATSGSNTITLAGGTLSQGTSCTVYANVTSNASGVYQNQTGNVASNEGGQGNSDAESLTVLNPPTVTITTPANHATYTYGQKVMASYSCQDDPNGPGLEQGGCQGNVASGSPINTTRAGRRSFTVTAISNDGQLTFKTVSFTVLGGNNFKVWNVYGKPNGRVGFDLDPQHPGKFTVVEHAVIEGESSSAPVLFGQLSRNASTAEGFVVYPSSAGQAMVKQVRSSDQGGRQGRILVTMSVTFTPAGGGDARTQTYRVTISP
jgi:uncharacterized repeat protein (TIGR01451 family)